MSFFKKKYLYSALAIATLSSVMVSTALAAPGFSLENKTIPALNIVLGKDMTQYAIDFDKKNTYAYLGTTLHFVDASKQAHFSDTNDLFMPGDDIQTVLTNLDNSTVSVSPGLYDGMTSIDFYLTLDPDAGKNAVFCSGKVDPSIPYKQLTVTVTKDTSNGGCHLQVSGSTL